MRLSKCKHLFLSLIVFGLIFLIGCTLRMANPDFNECATNCTKRQPDCITDAKNSGEIRLCKIQQTECIIKCEETFPRYIDRWK